VNRPTEFGFAGRSSPSGAITELRSGVLQPAPEIFSRRPPTPAPGRHWSIQDTGTLDTALLPKLPLGIGPYRSRPVDPGLRYEIVVVVGRRAWRMTSVPLEGLQLETRSVAMMRYLHLTFGAVTWSIAHHRREATIARVDSYPSMEQIRYAWAAVGESLLNILGK
jgi:hypothetical protein